MPAMAAIGGALGASAGSAALVGTTATLGAAGIGASLYGANKSAQAQKDAAAANKAAVDETNRLNYQRWLESQGVDSNGNAINTWLPRYANVTRLKGGVTPTAGFRFGNYRPTMVAGNVDTNGQMGSFAQPPTAEAPIATRMASFYGRGAPVNTMRMAGFDVPTEVAA